MYINLENTNPSGNIPIKIEVNRKGSSELLSLGIVERLNGFQFLPKFPNCKKTLLEFKTKCNSSLVKLLGYKFNQISLTNKANNRIKMILFLFNIKYV